MEEVPPSLIVSHYHTTYIPFNITKIKYTLSHLVSNLLIINNKLNKQSNNLTTIQYYHVSKALNDTYDTFEKLNNCEIYSISRKKRGLMNYIGSGIKFVTGNLDNDDLETITQNMQVIKYNQINSMHKINDLSSFAGNIVSKFEKNIKISNENAKNIRSEFSKLDNEIKLMLTLQNQYIQITNLNQYLEKILRIFSFAHLETLDLEILGVTGIKEIWQYLKVQYPKNALWPLQHLSELTLICKTGLLILTEMAILVVKIPIFEQNVCNLKLVYPVPDKESKILISPSKFYCNELWYNSCDEVNAKWICSGPIANSCSLSKNCQYATVQNNYQVHTLTNKKSLLFCSKTPETVYENCFQFQKTTLQGCHLIQSQCDVIINQHKYPLNINNISISFPEITKLQETNFSINLQIRHLENPTKMQEDLLEPVSFQDFPSKQHYSISFVTICIIFLCILALTLYLWQRQGKVVPVKLLQKLINEDVDETKGGEVITPNP